jgi:hypothetical protein
MNMLPSNGNTRIPHGVIPYLISLWRQSSENSRVSVGIASLAQCKLRFDSWRGRDLYLLQSVWTGSVSHAWVPETLSTSVNRPGRAYHLSSQSTAGVVSPLPHRLSWRVKGRVFLRFSYFSCESYIFRPFFFSVTFSRSWYLVGIMKPLIM